NDNSDCPALLRGCQPSGRAFFCVREKNDRPTLSMVFRSECIRRGIEPGSEICSSGTNASWPARAKRFSGGTEAIRQGTARDSPSRERDDGDTVPSFTAQSLHKTRGGFHGDSQSIRHRVFRPHAPARIHKENHVVSGRQCGRRRSSPTWLSNSQEQ